MLGMPNMTHLRICKVVAAAVRTHQAACILARSLCICSGVVHKPISSIAHELLCPRSCRVSVCAGGRLGNLHAESRKHRITRNFNYFSAVQQALCCSGPNNSVTSSCLCAACVQVAAAATVQSCCDCASWADVPAEHSPSSSCQRLGLPFLQSRWAQCLLGTGSPASPALPHLCPHRSVSSCTTQTKRCICTLLTGQRPVGFEGTATGFNGTIPRLAFECIRCNSEGMAHVTSVASLCVTDVRCAHT
jgi:hypothetical protein